MNVLRAIKERRSCRSFINEPISNDLIEKILEAATWAPSAANNQPWEFIVITNRDIKQRIHFESLICKKKIFDMSSWKWVDKYKADFLLEAPVIIAVIGDPKKIGAHQFLKGTKTVYQQACAAAIQNMLLAAHELGLGSLWFTLFDRYVIKKMLDIDEAKEPLALICIGKTDGKPLLTPRKNVKEITRFIN